MNEVAGIVLGIPEDEWREGIGVDWVGAQHRERSVDVQKVVVCEALQPIDQVLHLHCVDGCGGRTLHGKPLGHYRSQFGELLSYNEWSLTSSKSLAPGLSP